MRLIVTAGPTRQYVDTVRFITNASSGRMGYAVAAAAVSAGLEVTLLSGPVALAPPAGCEVVPFITIAELKQALEERFVSCDVLVMAAAVGDFQIESQFDRKLPRSGGPVDIRLLPTEDVLAGLARRKRKDQIIIAFAVEQGEQNQIEAKARAKLAAKGAEYVVLNTPAAISADESYACVLSADGVELPWADRPKEELAVQIVKLACGT